MSDKWVRCIGSIAKEEPWPTFWIEKTMLSLRLSGKKMRNKEKQGGTVMPNVTGVNDGGVLYKERG